MTLCDGARETVPLFEDNCLPFSDLIDRPTPVLCNYSNELDLIYAFNTIKQVTAARESTRGLEDDDIDVSWAANNFLRLNYNVTEVVV